MTQFEDFESPFLSITPRPVCNPAAPEMAVSLSSNGGINKQNIKCPDHGLDLEITIENNKVTELKVTDQDNNTMLVPVVSEAAPAHSVEEKAELLSLVDDDPDEQPEAPPIPAGDDMELDFGDIDLPSIEEAENAEPSEEESEEQVEIDLDIDIDVDDEDDPNEITIDVNELPELTLDDEGELDIDIDLGGGVAVTDGEADITEPVIPEDEDDHNEITIDVSELPELTLDDEGELDIDIDLGGGVAVTDGEADITEPVIPEDEDDHNEITIDVSELPELTPEDAAELDIDIDLGGGVAVTDGEADITEPVIPEDEDDHNEITIDVSELPELTPEDAAELDIDIDLGGGVAVTDGEADITEPVIPEDEDDDDEITIDVSELPELTPEDAAELDIDIDLGGGVAVTDGEAVDEALGIDLDDIDLPSIEEAEADDEDEIAGLKLEDFEAAEPFAEKEEEFDLELPSLAEMEAAESLAQKTEEDLGLDLDEIPELPKVDDIGVNLPDAEAGADESEMEVLINDEDKGEDEPSAASIKEEELPDIKVDTVFLNYDDLGMEEEDDDDIDIDIDLEEALGRSSEIAGPASRKKKKKKAAAKKAKKKSKKPAAPAAGDMDDKFSDLDLPDFAEVETGKSGLAKKGGKKKRAQAKNKIVDPDALDLDIENVDIGAPELDDLTIDVKDGPQQDQDGAITVHLGDDDSPDEPAVSQEVDNLQPVYNVFLSSINDEDKKTQVIEKMVEMLGKPQEEAEDLCEKIIIPVALNVSKPQAEVILNQFKSLGVLGRITKKRN
ncbi:hypothetical protein ACFL54_01730 [Planctomycetota bacterium]